MQQKIQNSISAGTLTQSHVTDASLDKGQENFLPSSTAEPLADGNASQSNPRLPVEFLSRNGKIKSFVGAVAMFNFESRVCIRAEGNYSFWKHSWNGEVFQEKLNISEILFKDIGSREFFKPWTGERLDNFLASIPPEASEQNNQAETAEKNNMGKSKTKKKTKEPKVGGKIEFVDELLMSGKFTKPEVAAELTKKFVVPEKTAKNTVSWAASTMKKRTGKESKHLPSERKSEAKPKKQVKKSALKNKVAKPEVATE